jgi:hypothetical protein
VHADAHCRHGQVSLKDLVSEVIVSLAEYQESCQYTCYHLACNGTRLNEYAPLEQYEVFRESSHVTLQMVEGAARACACA